MIAETALQEDVDVIGLSSLSGAHMSLFPRVMEELRSRDLRSVLVIAGGIIPDEDVPELERVGIEGVFGPGTSTVEVVQFITTRLGASAVDTSR
jgi:methylmalonyl-CoA mutase, C-terminal domain